MIVQKLSDGTYRIKDITHRQDLKRKGYSTQEIKKIEKDNISRGAERGWLDKPMKGAPDVTRMFRKDAPDFRQKMQKAKMNYLKKKGLSNYEAKNLKWVDGKLYYNNKDTGFTVRDLLR